MLLVVVSKDKDHADGVYISTFRRVELESDTRRHLILVDKQPAVS